MGSSVRHLKDYMMIVLKGMAMGAADIVPGVSGGTIALITGIYQELLDSIKKLTPAALIELKQGVPHFWSYINGTFLFALALGIFTSIFSLASIMDWALTHHALPVWGAFSGLIFASFLILAKRQVSWRYIQIILLIIGMILVIGLAELRPTQLEPSYPVLFLGGFIAISALLLPGVSGSFLLLLMGLYPVFISIIQQFNFTKILVIAAGCASGMMVFSRFLSWLLARYYTNTLALMLGLLLGSLYVTWPWKKVLETYIDRHGETIPLIQSNVLPHTFEQVGYGDAQLVLVLVCALTAFLLVLFAELYSYKIIKK